MNQNKIEQLKTILRLQLSIPKLLYGVFFENKESKPLTTKEKIIAFVVPFFITATLFIAVICLSYIIKANLF
jgi:hypothetical protein